MLEATVEALVAGQHPPSEGRFVSGEGLSSPSMRSRSSLPAERWAAHRAVQCRGRGARSLTIPKDIGDLRRPSQHNGSRAQSHRLEHRPCKQVGWIVTTSSKSDLELGGLGR